MAFWEDDTSSRTRVLRPQLPRTGHTCPLRTTALYVLRPGLSHQNQKGQPIGTPRSTKTCLLYTSPSPRDAHES
eukprot:2848460-Prymnesium_polylepis.1